MAACTRTRHLCARYRQKIVWHRMYNAAYDVISFIFGAYLVQFLSLYIEFNCLPIGLYADSPP
jgi:hypothetical protein